MVQFKLGEIALLQGQLVEIIDITIIKSSFWEDDYIYKVRLINSNTTHKIHKSKLKKIENQSAPSILFKNSKS